MKLVSGCRRAAAPKVKAAVTKALEEGIPASEILENGLLAGMDIIGQKFKNNEVFVPGSSGCCTRDEPRR